MRLDAAMPTWGELLIELQQLRQAGNKSPFDTVRRQYLSKFAAHTGRNVILYAAKWTQGPSDPNATSINPEDVQGLMEVIHGLTGPDLDLILHSPGGSAEATEALVKYLRSTFDNIRVFIPHAAMSAATMLACSANKIVMGKHSFIGPIDPQFIIQTDVGIKLVAAHAIIEQFKLAQRQCKNPALLPSWIPMLRQYGPALIVQCRLATQLSKRLVGEWLENHMFYGIPAAKKKAIQTARRLIDHRRFLSHGRFIDRWQARSFGLVVDDLETDGVLQDLLLSVFHTTTHTFNATGAVKLIESHIGRAFIKQQQMMIPVGVSGAPPIPPPPQSPQPQRPPLPPQQP